MYLFACQCVGVRVENLRVKKCTFSTDERRWRPVRDDGFGCIGVWFSPLWLGWNLDRTFEESFFMEKLSFGRVELRLIRMRNFNQSIEKNKLCFCKKKSGVVELFHKQMVTR